MSRWEQVSNWWKAHVSGTDEEREYLDHLEAESHLIRALSGPTGMLVDIEISPHDLELTASFRGAPDDEPVKWTIDAVWWTLRLPGGFTHQESMEGPGEPEVDPEWTQWYIDVISAYLKGSWRHVPLRAGILGRRRVTGVRIDVGSTGGHMELAPGDAGAVITSYSGPP